MDDRDDDSEVPLELTNISDARELAATAVMLLEHPKMSVNKSSGLYETALEQANLILRFVQMTEACDDAEEFDVLLNLICRSADNLAETLSLLRIP